MELQRTLDGRVVPVGPHRDDIIETEDGEFIRYGDIEYTDCKGRVYSDEEERDEADADIVAEILNAHSEWIDEYVASEDYGGEYVYMVCEDSGYKWKDPVSDWLTENTDLDGELFDAVCEGILYKLDEFDLELNYSQNEYYNGHSFAVCVDSFGVGEYESQIDVNGCPEFEELAAEGRLADALGRYNGDLYINYEGRDLTGRYPCFYGYGGCGSWAFGFSEETMKAALCAAIVDYCERVDGGKFGK
jgi:hypothetical protein